MHDIKLIVLDLDGTLLNSAKQLSAENEAALRKAAESGVEIVPATGRFFRGMPDVVRTLPYVHYAVTINGAQVYDVRLDKTVCASEIPNERALKVMEYMDTLPVIYDCYMDGWGWMTRSLWEQAELYAPTKHNAEMIRNLRTPVPELKAHIKEVGHGIQKMQAFYLDPQLRLRSMEELRELFPDMAVSSSISNNIEINSLDAQKGIALAKLAAYLGLDMSQTMAIGDDLNDLSMIKAAGVGVAMANGAPSVKAAADYITGGCDENGVAQAIEHYLWRENHE